MITRFHQPILKKMMTSARVHLLHEEYDGMTSHLSHICTENWDPVTFLEMRTAVESKLVYYYRGLQVHEEILH